jgi:hypothetical protein
VKSKNGLPNGKPVIYLVAGTCNLTQKQRIRLR